MADAEFPVRMTLDQARAFFGVSIKTFYRWRKTGFLKGCEIRLKSPTGIRPILRYDRTKAEEILRKMAGAR